MGVKCPLQVSVMETKSDLIEFLLEKVTRFAMKIVEADLCGFRTKCHQRFLSGQDRRIKVSLCWSEKTRSRVRAS